MEFEYTSSVYISDKDFNDMLAEMADGATADEAFDHWATGQDDDVYYNSDAISDDVIAELERRWAKAHEEPKPQPKQIPVGMGVIAIGCSNHDDCFFDTCPLSKICAAFLDED